MQGYVYGPRIQYNARFFLDGIREFQYGMFLSIRLMIPVIIAAAEVNLWSTISIRLMRTLISNAFPILHVKDRKRQYSKEWNLLKFDTINSE